ncbi:Hsp20/alpha crystallin family protein [Rhodococcus sp. UNC363MFTsu5.1]|uniref:Hsp20/alpha crystallin family protein n=1 Tax=Rhodococcus sp. UNC363MFTsu5.1 TaxID=1449069 RepID=UPI00048209B6|nr:Hsp20/alpha crystallin family protein [Rhodococcus sp. UNC363MFTsu5.1]
MGSVPARSYSVFPELADFFAGFPLSRMPTAMGGHMIRVEDKVENDRYLLRAELPGLDPKRDIKVAIHDGRLSIEAERTEESNAGGRSEFSYGSFSRTVSLPAGAREDDVEATYSKGILTVSVGVLPPPEGPREIEVKDED